MSHHTIAPLPENMVWGYLDAAVAPVLHVASGDTVALTSFAASNEARLPPDRSHWSRCASMQPRTFGGNMDNKELRAGATLYLPVFNEGALFYAGDGHGVQGDGEVCMTALETSLAGTFRLTVRKDLGYTQPFAESPTHLISEAPFQTEAIASRTVLRNRGSSWRLAGRTLCCGGRSHHAGSEKSHRQTVARS
jgi:Acetamidase/Formamidase family